MPFVFFLVFAVANIAFGIYGVGQEWPPFMVAINFVVGFLCAVRAAQELTDY